MPPERLEQQDRMSASPGVASSIPCEEFVWRGNVFLPLAAETGLSIQTGENIGMSKGKHAASCRGKQCINSVAERAASWVQSVVRQSATSGNGPRAFATRPSQPWNEPARPPYRADHVAVVQAPSLREQASAAKAGKGAATPPWELPGDDSPQQGPTRSAPRRPLFTMGTSTTSPPPSHPREASQDDSPLPFESPQRDPLSRSNHDQPHQGKPLFSLCTDPCEPQPSASPLAGPPHSRGAGPSGGSPPPHTPPGAPRPASPPSSPHGSVTGSDASPPHTPQQELNLAGGRTMEPSGQASNLASAGADRAPLEACGEEFSKQLFLSASVEGGGMRLETGAPSSPLRWRAGMDMRLMQNPYGREAAPLFAPVRSVSLPAETDSSPGAKELGSAGKCLRTAKSLPPRPFLPHVLEQVQSLVRGYTPVLLEALLELPPEEVPESHVERRNSWKGDNMWTPDLDLWAPGADSLGGSAAPNPKPVGFGTEGGASAGCGPASYGSAVLGRIAGFGSSWGGCRAEAHHDYGDFDDFHDTALDDLIGW